jgi:hypothetical protein
MKREREEELCNQKRDVSMAEKHRETEVTEKTRKQFQACPRIPGRESWR